MIVAAVSALVWVAALMLERMFGISWRYHPDAIRYVMGYHSVTRYGLKAVPNNLYYFISAAFDGRVWMLLALNCIAYCATNYYLWKYFRTEGRTAGMPMWLCIVAVFADAYRLHLALHPLKDSIVILCVVLVVVSRRRLVALPIMLLTRIASALYVLPLVKRRVLIASSLLLGVVLIFVSGAVHVLVERNAVAMGGRAFDTVPTFASLGAPGIVVRALTWPVLLISGAFVVLSPALAFLPIAACYALQQLGYFVWRRRVGVTAGVFVALVVIGAVVTTFTAFIRYAAPLMSVWLALSIRAAERRRTAAA